METKLDRICGNDKLDLIGSVNVFLFFFLNADRFDSFIDEYFDGIHSIRIIYWIYLENQTKQPIRQKVMLFYSICV